MESTFFPLKSFFSYKSAEVGVQTALQSSIWNLLKISKMYFFCDIKIPANDCTTSSPRKYYIRSKSVISNSVIIEALNASIMTLSLPVKIKSSTYKHTTNIFSPSASLMKRVCSYGHL